MEFTDIMAKNAKFLQENFDFPLYMENTFSGIAFYEEFFSKCDNAVNFCFDIGHTRVWSHENYEEWFGFLKQLDKNSVKLHFHIHTNNSIFDEHLGFFEKEDKESVAFIKKLQSEFSDSNFILEIQKEFKENLNLFCE